MKATLNQHDRIRLGADRWVEIVVWQLARPVPGSTHPFKYRLALIVDEVCVLRYDNEAGKGDHKHLGAVQLPYRFESLDRLLDDFWAEAVSLR